MIIDMVITRFRQKPICVYLRESREDRVLINLDRKVKRAHTRTRRHAHSHRHVYVCTPSGSAQSLSQVPPRKKKELQNQTLRSNLTLFLSLPPCAPFISFYRSGINRTHSKPDLSPTTLGLSPYQNQTRFVNRF